MTHLILRSDNLIYACDLPEEPELIVMSNTAIGRFIVKKVNDEYKAAYQSALSSAIPCDDQQQARWILRTEHIIHDVPDFPYPLPSYKMEVRERKAGERVVTDIQGIPIGYEQYIEKTAILSPIDK